MVLQFRLHGVEKGNCVNPLSDRIKCWKREKILKYIEPQRKTIISAICSIKNIIGRYFHSAISSVISMPLEAQGSG